jgi:hypothetical protein
MLKHETVTVPLHEGRTKDGRVTWYVVSESSDQADAKRRGVNYSNKLLNAVGTAAVQKVRLHVTRRIVKVRLNALTILSVRLNRPSYSCRRSRLLSAAR